jgi:hypothetical protein
MLYGWSNFVRGTGLVSSIRNLKLAFHRTAFITQKNTAKQRLSLVSTMSFPHHCGSLKLGLIAGKGDAPRTLKGQRLLSEPPIFAIRSESEEVQHRKVSSGSIFGLSLSSLKRVKLSVAFESLMGILRTYRGRCARPHDRRGGRTNACCTKAFHGI